MNTWLREHARDRPGQLRLDVQLLLPGKFDQFEDVPDFKLGRLSIPERVLIVQLRRTPDVPPDLAALATDLLALLDGPIAARLHGPRTDQDLSTAALRQALARVAAGEVPPPDPAALAASRRRFPRPD